MCPCAFSDRMMRFFCAGVTRQNRLASLHPDRQRGVVHLLYLAAVQHAGDRHAQLVTHIAGDQFAVAGDDLDVDPVRRQRLERMRRARLGRIEERGEAGEDQFGLIVDHGMRMIQRHRPPGDAEHLEAFLAEAVVQGLDRCQRLFVQRFEFFQFADGILRGQPEDILGRALDHEQPFIALPGQSLPGQPLPCQSIIDQHRNAPPLEVERHLVDLAPAA